MKLIIMVGLPASGKSTLAKQYAEDFGCKRIEYDAVPAPMLKKSEKVLELTDKYLSEGEDVIIDGIYVNKARRKNLVEVGRKHDAEICFYMVDATEEECIGNNAERKPPIDDGFIKLAARLYEEPTEDEYDTLIRSEEK